MKFSTVSFSVALFVAGVYAQLAFTTSPLVFLIHVYSHLLSLLYRRDVIECAPFIIGWTGGTRICSLSFHPF
jgi:hypothetical protein